MVGSSFEKAAWIFYGIVLTFLLPSQAETSVSDVLVSQRWPWSEKVDVEFTLTGDSAEVDVVATWDALRSAGTPAVTNSVVLGTLFDAAPGVNRFTWDPSASPWAGQTLTGFSVTLATPATNVHTYLVIDLQNGGVSYRAAPDGENGAWSDEYKSSKMVFRRIPAGTYTLGEPRDAFKYLGASDGTADTYYDIAGTRQVTLTSDFYVGVFRYTTAQRSWLENGCSGGDATAVLTTYDALRGGTNAIAELNVDWPGTKYRVATDSVVARLRAKAGGTLTVDLCEDEQWEVAARAGAGTFWPSGGTTDESYAVLSNHVNAIAVWRANNPTSGAKSVGQKDPNAWGLYDVVGGGTTEWVLDSSAYFNANGTLPSGTKSGKSYTDPVGGHCSRNLRIYRSYSGYGKTTTLMDLLPAMRRSANQTSYTTGVRFCIHLKPLKFAE